jgi:hypothetical protein
LPSERWRQPVEVLAIDNTVDQGVWLPDGRVQRAAQLTISDDSFQRIRTGHMCAKCFEPFEAAWPERCPVCGAPIRSDQAEYFAQEYGGDDPLGSVSKIIDERIHERARGEQ